MKMNEKFWCWWLSRSLWYEGRSEDGRYLFRDACDAMFILTEEDLATLEKIRVR